MIFLRIGFMEDFFTKYLSFFEKRVVYFGKRFIKITHVRFHPFMQIKKYRFFFNRNTQYDKTESKIKEKL